MKSSNNDTDDIEMRQTISLSSPRGQAVDSKVQVETVGAALPFVQEQQNNSPAKTTAAETTAVTIAIVLYGFCSSTLLVINKVAMWMMPDASFVLFCQFLTSAVAVRILKIAQPDMDIELITYDKAKPFALATLVFYLCLLSNTKALESVNVESVIVVRSCSPIAVAILEHLTLGRDLPSPKGLAALIAIAGGAVIYVLADAGFQIHGYMWLLFYFIFIVTEMVYVKFIVDSVKMSTWTRVYYNNVLSLPMALISMVVVGDMKFMKEEWSAGAVIAVAASCVVGVAISYAGFNLRSRVSATSFTVVGVVCKLVTVLLNDVMWSLHANTVGHIGLLLCIGSGFLYEQVKGERWGK